MWHGFTSGVCGGVGSGAACLPRGCKAAWQAARYRCLGLCCCRSCSPEQGVHVKRRKQVHAI